MAKTQNNAGTRAGNARNMTPAQKAATAAAKDTGTLSRYRNVLIPAAIAVVTWLFLSTCLSNTLTNWDDPGYISENPLIKDLSALGDILSTSIMGNYHPLTILTYAIEYSFVRLDPWLYHFDSLLLHVITTVLVYLFVNMLTRRPIAAAITALFFGIHPMHVESVAWLAGRKDVLYGAFYMAACTTYIKFVRSDEKAKWKWYVFTIVLFLCSLLSKPVAVALPLSLLLIDLFEGRKFDRAVIVEKILPFIISIGFGVRSVVDQAKFGALSTDNIAFTYAERIALGGYAFVTYLWKAIVPIDLACFYPYPLKPNGAIAATYYLYPVVAIAIIVVAWRLFRRNKALTFGALFFLANIALLLQFIPVGGAVLADRYSYIPYMGLFFIAGWLASELFEPGGNKQLATPVLAVIAVVALAYGYLANKQCKVWYDTTSLWRNEMEQFPTTHNAYNNLGFEYFHKYNASVTPAERKLYYDSSYYLLNQAIALQPDFVNSYISLGELLRTEGKYAEARKQYYTALSIKKNNDKQAEAYLGLAITYAILGLDYKARIDDYMQKNPGTPPMSNPYFDSSGFCFRKIFETKPNFAEAHSNYGNLLDINGKVDSAIAQYTIAISINPDLDDFRLNRGRAYIKSGRWDDAMKDFEQAIAISPEQGENYYARSLCYKHAGKNALALQDVQKAISLGFKQVDQNYYRSLQQQ